jgi:hypothetical protein
MTELKEIVSRFDSISLEEMDTVKLLNRVDTKYVFSSAKLPLILEELIRSYRMLEVCETRMNRYETLYYDTPDLQFYCHHHNGKLNRYKVRSRKYVDSETGFFEIKFKNNCGRTIKSRVRNDVFDGTLSDKPMKLLAKKTPAYSGKLLPTLRVFFTRITLVNRDLTERLTVDVGLHYCNDHTERSFPNIVIAEVKQDRTGQSEFHDLMKKQHIYRTGMSKYCFGICSLDFKVKKNNFKQKFIQINKINHEIS